MQLFSELLVETKGTVRIITSKKWKKNEGWGRDIRDHQEIMKKIKLKLGTLKNQETNILYFLI